MGSDGWSALRHHVDLPALLALLLALAVAPGHSAVAAGDEGSERSCALSPADARWAQRVVDDWDVITTEILGLPEAPLPWTVLYDAHCVWHLAADPATRAAGRPIASPLSFRGEPVHVLASLHGGTVRLPGGDDIPAGPRAFTALYSVDGRRRPYFVLAMASLWREQFSSTKMGFPLAMDERASGEWVQDEGFLVFLLIDELVPKWRREAFGPDPPSPVQMLEEALHGDASTSEDEPGRRTRR